MAASNLGDAVYATLSERILRWDYLPGHRVTEEELCAEFKVSRSPVREALNVLVENGLIEKRPKVGYRVRLLDFKEIDELYDLRIALEEFAVRKVCAAGTDPARLAALQEQWRALHAGLPATAGEVPAADEAFHESLAALTGNGILCRSLKDIDRRIHFVRLVDFEAPERVEATCLEHLALLDAMATGRVELALELLRRNIEGGRASVERAIKDALARAWRHND